MSKTWKVAKLTSETSSSPRTIRRALSCDGTFVAGAVADAPPPIAKETPAAPNTKAAFRLFRLEPRAVCTIGASISGDLGSTDFCLGRGGGSNIADEAEDLLLLVKLIITVSWRGQFRGRGSSVTSCRPSISGAANGVRLSAPTVFAVLSPGYGNTTTPPLRRRHLSPRQSSVSAWLTAGASNSHRLDYKSK